MTPFKKALIAAISGASLTIAAPAYSALTFELDFEFSGADEPEGTAPWLVATFTQVNATTVRLTMSASGLIEEEAVDDWYFNLRPELDPTALSISYVSGSTTVATDGVLTGVNAFKADGDGFFDIKFDFPPPPGSAAARFTGGETSVFDIMLAGGLSESDFNFASENGIPGNGNYLSAAHIQRIDQTTGNDNGGSGWIGDAPGGDDDDDTPGGDDDTPASVPEPGSLALLGLGLAGLAALRRRRG